MDQVAARLVNVLLGNDDNAAVIEAHFPAPEIVFDADCIAAVGGAEFGPELDGEPVENWRSFVAKKGSVLRFTAKIGGNRCYIAVQGGFEVDAWLGSSSTNLAAAIGGYNGRKLEIGDCIGVVNGHFDARYSGRRIAPSVIPMYRPFPTVRVIPGAEFEFLDARGRDLLECQDFSISNSSNRMGFRLSGKPINLSRNIELVSAAVSFGTIQLLPDRQLIVLMADHQTTGGYPRIAHVISRDLPLIAQLGANDKVAFHLVDIAHAEDLALEFEKELNFLRVAAKILK